METNKTIENKYCGYIVKRNGKIVLSVAKDTKTGETQIFSCFKKEEDI